jgi:hypothetical protein
MFIKSGNICIKISAKEEVINAITSSLFLFQYIPDVQILDCCKNIKAELKVVDDRLYNLKINNDKYFLKMPDPIIRYKDVITIAEYILEKLREKEGIYCLHGSAVSWRDKGVWLWGPISGLGKTSVAIGLCQNYGFRLIGDEKILINNKGEFVGGVRYINYNKKSLEKSISQNLNDKTDKELSKLIKLENRKIKLSLIVLPISLHLANFIDIEKWESGKSAFHLYEELSRKIRGVSRRIIDFTTPIESFDNNNLSLVRSLLANKMARDIPSYVIKGNPTKIQEEIKKILKV